MAVTGRPSLYNKEILEKTIGYIETCGETHEIKTKPVIKDGLVGDEEYVKARIKLPTIEGLSLALNINPDTIYSWRKEEDKQEFSELIDRLLKKQADMLIEYGLSGEYNPTIAKVLLTKHGYREGIDATTNDKEINTPQFTADEQTALLSLLNDKASSS